MHYTVRLHRESMCDVSWECTKLLRESKQVANLGSANYSSTRLNFLYGLIFNLVEYVIKTVALTTIDE